MSGRHLSPVVGLPCAECLRPTGDVERNLCDKCERMSRIARGDARLLRDMTRLDDGSLSALLYDVMASRGAEPALAARLARTRGDDAA